MDNLPTFTVNIDQEQDQLVISGDSMATDDAEIPLSFSVISEFLDQSLFRDLDTEHQYSDQCVGCCDNKADMYINYGIEICERCHSHMSEEIRECVEENADIISASIL